MKLLLQAFWDTPTPRDVSPVSLHPCAPVTPAPSVSLLWFINIGVPHEGVCAWKQCCLSRQMILNWSTFFDSGPWKHRGSPSQLLDRWAGSSCPSLWISFKRVFLVSWGLSALFYSSPNLSAARLMMMASHGVEATVGLSLDSCRQDFFPDEFLHTLPQKNSALVVIFPWLNSAFSARHSAAMSF